MEWWIGFWVAVGALYVLHLDYRGRRATGRRWLAPGWAARIPFYALFGGFWFGILAYIPVLLFNFARTFWRLAANPLSLDELQILLPGFAGILAAYPFFMIASERWQAGVRYFQIASHSRGIAALVLGTASLAFGLLSITVGFVITLQAAKGL